jgi:ABC-type polysaccharide/polyol phosphate transport system ATPase subunit
MPSTIRAEAPEQFRVSRLERDLPSIELEGVGVRFRVPEEKIPSLKEYLVRLVTRGMRYRELWATDGVDLVIHPGETFGIVGPNGAGKSTLLKVVARVLRPTTGRVVVRGRVAPLLELGAGFHLDLTGEENIYLNATLLGHGTKEIDARFEEVVEFAELEDFVHLPIRKYSTGMVARLGFSVATMYRPEVLLLDEVLAVGDIRFQRKCLARIESFRAQGTTILLVSHALETLEHHCERVAWLDSGLVQVVGPASEVLQQYREKQNRY